MMFKIVLIIAAFVTSALPSSSLEHTGDPIGEMLSHIHDGDNASRIGRYDEAFNSYFQCGEFCFLHLLRLVKNKLVHDENVTFFTKLADKEINKINITLSQKNLCRQEDHQLYCFLNYKSLIDIYTIGLKLKNQFYISSLKHKSNDEIQISIYEECKNNGVKRCHIALQEIEFDDLIRKKKIPEALILGSDIIKSGKYHSYFLFDLAEAYENSGDYQKALNYYLKLLDEEGGLKRLPEYQTWSDDKIDLALYKIAKLYLSPSHNFFDLETGLGLMKAALEVSVDQTQCNYASIFPDYHNYENKFRSPEEKKALSGLPCKHGETRIVSDLYLKTSKLYRFIPWDYRPLDLCKAPSSKPKYILCEKLLPKEKIELFRNISQEVQLSGKNLFFNTGSHEDQIVFDIADRCFDSLKSNGRIRCGKTVIQKLKDKLFK